MKASPGGWTLYTSKCIGKQGFIIACDLLELDSLCLKSIQDNCRVQCIYGDFTQQDIQHQIVTALQHHHSITTENILSIDKVSGTSTIVHKGIEKSIPAQNTKVDCIISDMATNFTGDRTTDAFRTMNLCEDALRFAIGQDGFQDEDSTTLLKKGGSFLCKFFPCGKDHEQDLLHRVKRMFRYTTLLKPPASRKDSSEVYLYAGGYL